MRQVEGDYILFQLIYCLFAYVEPVLALIAGVQGLIFPKSFIESNFGFLSFSIEGYPPISPDHPLLIAFANLTGLCFIAVGLILFGVMTAGNHRIIYRVFLAFMIPDIINLYVFVKFYLDHGWYTGAYINLGISGVLFLGRVFYLLMA